MRTLPPLLALAVAVAAAGSTSTARAVASLAEARCLCADGALNTGDYVSCIAQLTRRLEAVAVLTSGERAEAISEASRTDHELLSRACIDSGPLSGWGVSIDVGTPFYPTPAPSEPVAAASVRLRLWNFTGDDVFQNTPSVDAGEGCGFVVRVLDVTGQVLREDIVACEPSTGTLDMPSGSIEEVETLLPIAFLNSTRGDPDGVRLPAGTYLIEGTWLAHGPQATTSGAFDGGMPSARITVRVGS